MWQCRFLDGDRLGHGDRLLAGMELAVQAIPGPRSVAIPVSKTQMLATLSPCGPGCPMSFLHVLITPGYNQ